MNRTCLSDAEVSIVFSRGESNFKKNTFGGEEKEEDTMPDIYL